MAFEKITDSELESVGVELLDDVPGLSPGAMKATVYKGLQTV